MPNIERLVELASSLLSIEEASETLFKLGCVISSAGKILAFGRNKNLINLQTSQNTESIHAEESALNIFFSLKKKCKKVGYLCC